MSTFTTLQSQVAHFLRLDHTAAGISLQQLREYRAHLAHLHADGLMAGQQLHKQSMLQATGSAQQPSAIASLAQRHEQVTQLIASRDPTSLSSHTRLSNSFASPSNPNFAASASSPCQIQLLSLPTTSSIPNAPTATTPTVLCITPTATPMFAASNLTPEQLYNWIDQEQGHLPMRPHPQTRYKFLDSPKTAVRTSFGWLVRAEDLATHRVLVIKLSYLSHMRAGRAMDNPLREVCMLSRLGQHENIAKLVEASFDVEKHWMVLERAANGDLLRRLNEHRTSSSAVPSTTSSPNSSLSPPTTLIAHAWWLFGQLIDAVEYMHQQRIGHFDISLENCLLSEEDDLRLCDFGQARELPFDSVGKELPFTDHSRFGNKSYYLPPEFITKQPFYGTQFDLFACGVLLYIMLVGSPPFSLATLQPRGGYARIVNRGQLIQLAREQCTRGLESIANEQFAANKTASLSETVDHMDSKSSTLLSADFASALQNYPAPTWARAPPLGNFGGDPMLPSSLLVSPAASSTPSVTASSVSPMSPTVNYVVSEVDRRCSQCHSDDPNAGCCSLSQEAAAVIEGLLAPAERRLKIAKLRQMPWMMNMPAEVSDFQSL